MSQKYQDFIKNYLNEKADNEQKSAVVSYFSKPTEDGYKKAFEALKAFDVDDWKALLPQDLESFKREFKKNQKFTYRVKNKDGQEETKFFLIYNKEEKSLDSRLTLIIPKSYLTNTDENPSDAQKNIAINFFKATKLNEKDLEDLQKIMSEKSRWSFQRACSEYEDLGRILTYKSIDVIYHCANTEKISEKDLMYGLKNAFKTEKVDYFNSLSSIDQKMDIDAVAACIEDEKARNNESIIVLPATLNESKSISEMDLNEYFTNIHNLSGSEIDKFLKDFIDSNKEDVETKKKTLQARFEKGRKEIIDQEKKDEMQDFKDPVTGTVEKRVGRLGHFGPMTYIKNHPDLNKAVDAIDKQNWNIFNCAAKLLIKFFKVIEHGEKKWQEFLDDVRSQKKEIIGSLNNKKQKDFNADYENIANGDGKPENKFYDILNEYSANVIKYEKAFIDTFTTLDSKPLVSEKDGKYFINQNVKDTLNAHKNNLGNVETGYQVAMEKIKAIVDASQKPKENEKAPEENANYKPVFNNSMINEIDANKGQIVKQSQEEIDKASAEASKNKDKNKEAKPQQTENSFDLADWRNQKFKFDLSAENFTFGKFAKPYQSGESSKIADTIVKLAEGIEDKNYKTVYNVYASLIRLFNSKSNDARLLSYDEITTNTMTAGEMVDKSKALFEAVKKVVDIPEFSDVEISNIEDLRKEFGGAVKQISNVVEIVNDPVLLAIGHEKKEDASEEVPQQLIQQVKTVNQEIAVVDDRIKKPENASAFIQNAQKQIEAINNEIAKNDTLKKAFEVVSQKFKDIFQYFIPKMYFYKKFLSQDMQAIGQETKALMNNSYVEEISDLVLNLNEEENKGLNFDEISQTVAELCGNCEKLVDNAKEKNVEDFIKEYNDWTNKVNELYKNLMSSEEFKQKNADDLKLLNDEKIKSDPFYILLVIYGIFQKLQNNNEEKKEINQEETQDKGTETNSGDTKAIGQDVSSKVPAKAEEKKEESFSNELAEDLYKYLRG